VDVLPPVVTHPKRFAEQPAWLDARKKHSNIVTRPTEGLLWTSQQNAQQKPRTPPYNNIAIIIIMPSPQKINPLITESIVAFDWLSLLAVCFVLSPGQTEV
jgi:hypothetical protein